MSAENVGAILGVTGIIGGLGLSSWGAALGFISGASLARAGEVHQLSYKMLLPMVLASALVVYSLVPAVMIATSLGSSYSLIKGISHFGGGLIVGIACLAAGYALGKVGEAGSAVMARPELFTIWLVMLIMAELIAIIGFVVSMMLMNKNV